MEQLGRLPNTEQHVQCCTELHVMYKLNDIVYKLHAQRETGVLPSPTQAGTPDTSAYAHRLGEGSVYAAVISLPTLPQTKPANSRSCFPHRRAEGRKQPGGEAWWYEHIRSLEQASKLTQMTSDRATRGRE